MEEITKTIPSVDQNLLQHLQTNEGTEGKLL